MMDLLLAHGHFLYDDPRERQVMQAYPPPGRLIAFCRVLGIAE